MSLFRKAGLICLAVLICSLYVSCAYAKDNIIVGKVSLISGDVQICRSEQNEWTALKFNELINVADRVKLGNESKLEVCYNDGNILRAAQNSELEFDLETVKLFNGQTWLRIVKVGTKFEVIAPTFVAGVRGTVFSVKTSKNAAKKDTGAVKVWKGAVETKAASKSTMITQGQTVSVDDKLMISNPETFDINAANEFSEGSWQASDEKTAYNRYINLLFGGIDQAEARTNPELKKQLEIRKKLPEVMESYGTYKSFSDMKALDSVSGQ